MITMNLQVTKQSYADMIIKNVIPAIREKWPVGVNGCKTVYIQHDNASTHFGSDYVPFLARRSYFGWMDINLTGQPANSPEMNINNLSFFFGHFRVGNGIEWRTLIMMWMGWWRH